MCKKSREKTNRHGTAGLALMHIKQSHSHRSAQANRRKVGWFNTHWLTVGLVAFLGIGVIAAGRKYLTEAPTGSVLSSMPSPPPKLTKEYIYAGSKLLVIEDAGAVSPAESKSALQLPSRGFGQANNGTDAQQVSKNQATSDDLFVP